MSLRINYNTSAIHAFQNLRGADRTLAGSIERLSSGIRIKRANDDPAALTLSNALRHHLSGLDQALDNSEEAIGLMQTAEGALDTLSSLMIKARELALGAANTGVNDENQLRAYQQELDSLIRSVTRIADNTVYGAQKLLNGDFGDITLEPAAIRWFEGLTKDTRHLPGGIQDNSPISISQVQSQRLPIIEAQLYDPAGASGQPLAATTLLNGLQQVDGGLGPIAIAGGEDVRISGPNGSITITLAPTSTIADFVEAANLAGRGIGVRAQYDASNGTLRLESTSWDQDGTLVVDSDVLGATGLMDPQPGNATTNSLNSVDNNDVALTELVRERVSVTLQTGVGGVPSRADTIDGLLQVGDGAGALTVSGGEQVRISGPKGTASVILTPTMSIDVFVKLANANTERTGAQAAYDEATGVLTIENLSYGAGVLSVDSDPLANNTNGTPADPSDDYGVGLLDTRSGDPYRNDFEPPRDRFAMTFYDNDPLAPSLVTDPSRSIFHLRTGANPADPLFNAIDGKSFTIYGNGISASMALNEPTTAVDLAEAAAAASDAVSYESDTGNLSVSDGAGGTLAALTVDADTTLSDLETFFETRPRPDATGFTVTLGGGTIDLEEWGTVATHAIDPLQPADLADFIATNIAEATWAPGGGNNNLGLLTIDDGANPPVTFHFDADNDGVTDANVIDDLHTFMGANRALMNRGYVGTAGSATVLGSTGNTVTSITRDSGTTIQDVMDFVNSTTATTGAIASFSALTGTLQVSGQRGSIELASEDLTAGNLSTGLLDSNTQDPDDNGYQYSFDRNATVDISFVDEGGTTRSLTLTQIATSDGGRRFTNLTGGPQPDYADDTSTGPRFAGWEPGAFSLTLRDDEVHDFGASLQVADRGFSATRVSNKRFQTGGLSGQNVAIEIADMRADALGRSAGLFDQGFSDLQDLVDRQSLRNGESQQAILLIDAVINEISAQRGSIGALQEHSVANTITELQIHIENLTQSESMLRDTDFAAESAEFARANIIYQSATSMLAQANQLPQTILQLLG